MSSLCAEFISVACTPGKELCFRDNTPSFAFYPLHINQCIDAYVEYMFEFLLMIPLSASTPEKLIKGRKAICT